MSTPVTCASRFSDQKGRVDLPKPQPMSRIRLPLRRSFTSAVNFQCRSLCCCISGVVERAPRS
jgi:hypothetical protein